MTHAPDACVLLRLRWFQLRRAWPAFGRWLLAFTVVGLVWGVRNAAQNDPTLTHWIAGGTLLTLIGLHQRRADHHFVQRHVPRARLAMALEYGVLVLPAFVGLLLAMAWIPAALVPTVLALPWMPVKRSSGIRAAWLRKWIPARLFEWKSMLQSTHPWSLLLWLAALGFSWLPVLPMFLLGMLALMTCGAQEPCESRAMLLATSTDARALLRTKLIGAARIMLVLQLPVLIGATIVRPGWWWIHASFGLGMVVLVAYSVALKYANYRPNERLEANGANVTIAALLAILPGLGLVPLVMLLNEWRNARANLNTYFHAHHH